MEAKQQEVAQILPPAAAATPDEESQTVLQSKASSRRKTWIILASIIIIFLAVDTVLFLVLDHIFFQVRTPEYSLQSVTVENLRVRNSSGSIPPSFNMQLNGQVKLRNKNFGSYSFGDEFLTFSYGDKPVGVAVITETRVKARSTKTMGFVMNVTSKAGSRNSNLGRDIASGSVKMTAFSDLRGQVRFLIVYPKDKSAILNCDLSVNFVKGIVEDLRCD